MQITNRPNQIAVPFADNGVRQSIPVDSQISVSAGRASMNDGFPPLTRTPLAAGGVPPFGTDMNGILWELSSALRWQQSGAGFPFSSEFAASIAGYPLGSIIPSSNGEGYWINTVESNQDTPETTDGSTGGWGPINHNGATSVSMSSSSVVLSALDAAKERIILAGTLTANLNLTMPAWAGKKWLIENQCSGDYSVAIKTSIGGGVAINSGEKAQLYCDGEVISYHSLLGDNLLLEIAQLGASAQALAQQNIGLADSNGYVGRLIGTQTLTATSTVTPPTGAKYLEVEAVGGGGSGGASNATSSGQTSLGTGGGAGSYGRGFYPVNFTSLMCTVGSGGAQTNIGVNNGNNGGASTVGSLLNCPGGKGGVSKDQAKFPYFVIYSGQSDDCTGWNVATTPGASSIIAFTVDGTNISASGGADSKMGIGGLSYSTVGNGSGGRAFGSGGGGAVSNNGSAGFNGGAGANGVIILRWYK